MGIVRADPHVMHKVISKLPVAFIAVDICTAAGVAGSCCAEDTHMRACVQVDANGWRAAEQAHGQGDVVLCRPARRRLSQVRSMLLERLLDGPREVCCTALSCRSKHQGSWQHLLTSGCLFMQVSCPSQRGSWHCPFGTGRAQQLCTSNGRRTFQE